MVRNMRIANDLGGTSPKWLAWGGEFTDHGLVDVHIVTVVNT
jgi:hypothetical protein